MQTSTDLNGLLTPKDFEATKALIELMSQDTLANLTKAFEELNAPKQLTLNVVTIVAFGLIFLVSLLGNLMVCFIIATNKQLHSIISCFIANLSVSDLLMTLVNMPFGSARLLLDNWPFGQTLCKFLPFIQATSVYVSTITMCVISIDRYFAVVHPLAQRIRRQKTVTCLLLTIWAASFTLALPFAYYNEVVDVDGLLYTYTRCRALYPSDEHPKWITMFAFATQYAIPLSIASISYGIISFHLRSRSQLGAMTEVQQKNISRINQQTIKMLVMVLISFAVSWAPLHMFYLYVDFLSSNTNRVYRPELFILVYWLAMASSSHNAFIYSMRNQHFRSGMRKLLKCWSSGDDQRRSIDTRMTTLDACKSQLNGEHSIEPNNEDEMLAV